MSHACISFVGDRRNDQAGMMFEAGDTNTAFVSKDNVTQNQGDVIVQATAVVTMPLVRIAAKLGVQSIRADRMLPPGIWIADGSADGAAFNYVELIDKMTDRMADFT